MVRKPELSLRGKELISETLGPRFWGPVYCHRASQVVLLV